MKLHKRENIKTEIGALQLTLLCKFKVPDEKNKNKSFRMLMFIWHEHIYEDNWWYAAHGNLGLYNNPQDRYDDIHRSFKVETEKPQ